MNVVRVTVLTVYVCNSLLPKPHSPSLQPLPSAIVQISAHNSTDQCIQCMHAELHCASTVETV
jgi:hypothetical protein